MVSPRELSRSCVMDEDSFASCFLVAEVSSPTTRPDCYQYAEGWKLKPFNAKSKSLSGKLFEDLGGGTNRPYPKSSVPSVCY